jgi:hypothetical protein
MELYGALTMSSVGAEKLKVESGKQKSKGGNVVIMPPADCGVLGGTEGLRS